MTILSCAALSASFLISKTGWWKKVKPLRYALNHTCFTFQHIHPHTHGPAPGVGWCCPWGRGDSPDFWSRVSARQPQSPVHIAAQPGGPLLQEKHTAHCPTLLMRHSEWGNSMRRQLERANTHKNTQAYLAQMHPWGCWPPSESPALWISLHAGDLRTNRLLGTTLQ